MTLDDGYTFARSAEPKSSASVATCSCTTLVVARLFGAWALAA